MNNNQTKNLVISKSDGFSIIEMLVAASIFMVVMVVVAGIYVRVLDLQRRTQGLAQVQDNVLFVIETLSREVRVSEITSGNNPSCSASSITLNHPTNGIVEYQILNGVIQRKQGAGSFEDITTPEISFTSFNMCITGTGSDNAQTRVTILLTAENVTTTIKNRVPFTIQTTVASRNLSVDLAN